MRHLITDAQFFCRSGLFQVNGNNTKKRLVKEEREDDGTDIQDDEQPGISTESHLSESFANSGKVPF